MKTGIFYGWWVVATVFLAQMVAIGTTTYAYSVFLKPISVDFAVERGEFSMGMSGMMFVAMLTSPFIGSMLDRYSIRQMVVAGGVLLGGGFLLMSLAPSLIWLGIGFWIPVGIGSLIAGPTTAAKLISSWFEVRRGTALGISAVGTSAGGFIVPPLAMIGIEAWGWRGTLFAMGVANFVMIVPAALLIIRNRPEDCGLAPDGRPDSQARRQTAGPVAAIEPPALLNLLRQRSYWGLAFGFGIPLAIVSGTMSFLHAYATDHGMSDQLAAWLISALSGSAMLGKLVFGVLADRKSLRGLAWAGIGLQGGFLAMLLGTPSHGLIFLAACIGGIGLGGLLPVYGALVARTFGAVSVASIMGLIGPVMTALTIVAFSAAGWLYSAEVGYDRVFQTFILACVIAASFVALVECDGQVTSCSKLGARSSKPATR